MKSGELKVRQRTCLDGTFSFQTLWFGHETRVGRSETITCIKTKNILDSIFFVFVTSVCKPKTKLSESDIQYFEFIFSVSSSFRVSAESVLDFYHSFCAGG